MALMSKTLFPLHFLILSVAAQCDTYITIGPAGNHTFMNYAFYDFRQLGNQISGTPVYSQNSDFNNPQFGLSTSPYFNSTAWTAHWSNMNYKQVANQTLSQYVDTVYTPLSVSIVTDNSPSPDGQTVLSLTTTRLQTYSPSAYIQSIQKYMHASVRVSARITGATGACGSIYFYGDDNNESDIEVLTNDTVAEFHATNHPSQDARGNPIAGATTKATIPQNGTVTGTTPGSWEDWNDWRIDWLPDRTQWIINGDLVVDKTWHPPTIPAFIGINMWSNGGSWTGNMSIGANATLEVRWIEVVFNTTSDNPPAGNATCVVGANNDASNIAAKAANSTGTRMSSSLAFVWSLVIASMIWSLR